jgi:hypothetical protein
MHHDPIDLPDNWAGEYAPDGLTEADVDALLAQAGIDLDDLGEDPNACWEPPTEPADAENTEDTDT